MPIAARFRLSCDSCQQVEHAWLEMQADGTWIARESPIGWEITARTDDYHNDIVATCSDLCRTAIDAIERLEPRPAKSEPLGG